MQLQEDIIKSIVPTQCPHCSGVIFVEFKSGTPVLQSVYTSEDVRKAKEDLKGRIETLSIEEDKKKSVIEWASKEETVFGPGEVETIVASLLK